MALHCRSMFTTALGIVCVLAASACGENGDRAELTPVLPSLGPESLTVGLTRAPDTLVAGASLAVEAMAWNRTARPIVAQLQCPSAGLTLRLLDAQGQSTTVAAAACLPNTGIGTVTIAPGDSAALSATLSVTPPAGSYRLQVVYEAVNGRSRPAERALVIRTPVSPQQACTPSDARVAFGVYVAVRDAATRAPLLARVVASSGSYQEVLTPGPGMPGGPPSSYYGAAERPGTYAVVVTAPGYREWRQDSVKVTVGADCHVVPVQLTALLDAGL